MPNAKLERDVLDELLWDESINPSRIDVSANGGEVTLSGAVGTFHEKWDAGEDAWRVSGVEMVRNEVVVDRVAERLSDHDLLAKAEAGLDANSLIPKAAITVTVNDGWVNMTGNVRRYSERRAAEHVIRHLPGLYGFTDRVTVAKDPARAVSKDIATALTRNASVDANRIKVSDIGGVVTLTGTVRSYVEGQEAERSAWTAPGVTGVNNELLITG
jgi:osmotically-inducible protein OsmY